MFESPHIARSFTKTCCPWFLGPSNKTLATEPFPSGMVDRYPEAPIRKKIRSVLWTTASVSRISSQATNGSETSGTRTVAHRAAESW